MPPAIDPAELADETRLARLISEVEAGAGAAREVLASLPPSTQTAYRVGITGSPGIGKSTLLRHLIAHYRQQAQRVGVIAVDPTSPFSGGAVLADRLRLTDKKPDPGVFIRSLGSRGSLGGISPAASAVATVLVAAGFDLILIETVGVGQTGYDIVNLADTVVAMFSPEAGDGVQLLKAGILEVGDIFAVNKCDRPGAEQLLAEIKLNLELEQVSAVEQQHHGLTAPSADEAQAIAPPWQPPVLPLVATANEGIAELAQAIEAHQQYLTALPATHPLRSRRIVRELTFSLRTEIEHLVHHALDQRLAVLAQQVQAGELALWQAVEELRRDIQQRI